MLSKEALMTLDATFDGATNPTQAWMTLREGGVSSGPYGNAQGIMGLNVGDHVGDHPRCVSMNRNLVETLLGVPVTWMTQVHGAHVAMADAFLEKDRSTAIEADAVISATPHVACGVMVADCLPILVQSASGNVVAAIHGGWRPLARGIVDKTIRLMKEKTGETLHAWVGPGISADSFEVGPEVVGYLLKALEGTPSQTLDGILPRPTELPAWATASEEGDRFHVALASVAERLLIAAGVATVHVSPCFTDDAEHFYSFRREGQKTGRHVAVIRANE